MTIAYDAQHQAEAKNRLISQFANKPRILAVVDALASRTQAIEDAVLQVAQKRFLSSAQGAQLDTIGSIVGIARNGQPDDVYKLLIIGEIYRNNSRATISDVLRVTKALFGADQVMAVTPNSFGQDPSVSSAELTLYVGSPTTDLTLLPTIVKIIKLCLPQGVSLLAISTFSASKAMSTAGPQPWCGGFGSPLGGILYSAAS